jgi:hypothetical protein
MRTLPKRRGQPGFISYMLVLTTGAILTLLMVLTYRRAMAGQAVQKNVQLRLDYSEKEDAILRSIVAITPNRAIRAMQHHSNLNTTISNPLRWENIFTEALVLANARTSIPGDVLSSLGIPNLRTGNTGDSVLGTPSVMFQALLPKSADETYVSVGVNRSLGSTFPPPLTTSTATRALDLVYPIISADQVYGTLAQAGLDASGVGLSATTYPKFNRLKYPQISFGYAKPGDGFVAKRSWWGFSLDVAAQDYALTKLARPGRDFVLSIYEVPSQLAISASSFMSLGQYASGEAWQNVMIDGGVFAGKAVVEGSTAISALASRRSMTLSGDTTIGGQSFASSPFTPGVRETYQLTHLTEGDFFPASLASESGRVAFVPINRGSDFFDRFSLSTEDNVLSPTTWNSYSIGALQCAMRLDITQVVSAMNMKPTALRFSYLKAGVRKDLDISLTTGAGTGLPAGYIYACEENTTYNFGTTVVDVAYGLNGYYGYQTGVTGLITFNNARFGDPLVGTLKKGYFKPSYPFEWKQLLATGQHCIAVYPQRFAAFLTAINGDKTATNNSLVVNVDYSVATGSAWLTKPSIPCTDLDYGVIVQECADLTSFTKGFSLVTNLRTYMGDDFNIVEVPKPWPTGYTPAITPTNPLGKYYPPCSMFAPERRYGVDIDPFAVSVSGQIGSLASDTVANPIRPLDSKNMSGNALASNRITVNLRPITHPCELPPITMKNWLVVLEERRKEFVGY